jgi:hypothetical protein
MVDDTTDTNAAAVHAMDDSCCECEDGGVGSMLSTFLMGETSPSDCFSVERLKD